MPLLFLSETAIAVEELLPSPQFEEDSSQLSLIAICVSPSIIYSAPFAPSLARVAPVVSVVLGVNVICPDLSPSPLRSKLNSSSQLVIESVQIREE